MSRGTCGTRRKAPVRGFTRSEAARQQYDPAIGLAGIAFDAVELPARARQSPPPHDSEQVALEQ